MDAGLQIKDLARLLGVTEDSIINWAIRGMRPAKRNVPVLLDVFPDLTRHLLSECGAGVMRPSSERGRCPRSAAEKA